MSTALLLLMFVSGGFTGWFLCRLYIAASALKVLKGSTTPASPTLIRLARLTGVIHHG